MLGVWDPYFGWDWHRVRSMLGFIVLLSLFVMFIASTEGLPWYYPFEYVGGLITNRATEALITVFCIAIGLYWYWLFQRGDF